jgi:hypothetical protein
MKARVKLTPDLLKRLLDGKPLEFTLPAPATELEVVLQEDIFSKFDRVFGKMWNSVLDKLDKLT